MWNLQSNPVFSNLQGKRKLVREIGRFEKSRVNEEKSMSKGNENWFEKSGGLRNRGLEKSGCHCMWLLITKAKAKVWLMGWERTVHWYY